eukprot:scaffold281974_cov35-Tisochrysis_lutea.AAC.1
MLRTFFGSLLAFSLPICSTFTRSQLPEVPLGTILHCRGSTVGQRARCTGRASALPRAPPLRRPSCSPLPRARNAAGLPVQGRHPARHSLQWFESRRVQSCTGAQLKLSVSRLWRWACTHQKSDRLPQQAAECRGG